MCAVYGGSERVRERERVCVSACVQWCHRAKEGRTTHVDEVPVKDVELRVRHRVEVHQNRRERVVVTGGVDHKAAVRVARVVNDARCVYRQPVVHELRQRLEAAQCGVHGGGRDGHRWRGDREVVVLIGFERELH
jgi:hypothetical protein